MRPLWRSARVRPFRMRAPALVPRVQVAQLHAQHGRLEAVHAEVASDQLVDVGACLAVQAHLGEIARGGVRRYALPRIGALNFVVSKALGGGVTRSAALDKHGKTLSSALLELELPKPET